jgi:purine-binding chemotaxis protein CheW
MNANFAVAGSSPVQEGMRLEAQLAVFRVGAEMYALDIMRIREIIRPQKLTSVPNAPPFIEGVINLRGAIIPVLDLRKRFGQPMEINRKSRVVVCVLQGKSIGLIVDEVHEVRRCTRQDIQPPPQYMRGRGTEVFLGVCGRGEELVMIIDLERVLSSGERFELESIPFVQKESPGPDIRISKG